MKQNLKLGKIISFNEFIKHGIDNGANIINNIPWSWNINGNPVTHENDNTYIINTIDGIKYFHRNEYLIAYENGLKILVDHGDTHAPNGCPM